MFALPLKFLGGQERPFGPARLIRDICEGVCLLDTVGGGAGAIGKSKKQTQGNMPPPPGSVLWKNCREPPAKHWLLQRMALLSLPL